MPAMLSWIGFGLLMELAALAEHKTKDKQTP